MTSQFVINQVVPCVEGTILFYLKHVLAAIKCSLQTERILSVGSRRLPRASAWLLSVSDQCLP